MNLHASRMLLLVAFYFLLSASASEAQDCDLDFPGTTTSNYSTSPGACGSASIGGSVNVGKNTQIGDNDTFTFDSPATINIGGSIQVKAVGSGKIIIPAGVTVNVSGSFQLDDDGGCGGCSFEIEVNGNLNVTGNLQNNLDALTWTGTGTVDVDANFENSSNGCMDCGATCPAFPTGSGCSDSGSGCSIDFCTDGNYGSTTPIPIELAYFDVTSLSNEVLLIWETASEINNDYFTIERSAGGFDFEGIGIVDGSGTTSEYMKYSFRDLNPINGFSYYRLKQTDFDGTSSYSHTLSVGRNLEDTELIVAPNPVSEGRLNLQLPFDNGRGRIEIKDLRGATVFKRAVRLDSNRDLILNLQSVPNGFYVMQILQNGLHFSKPLTIVN